MLSCLQTLDEQELYTDEEFEDFQQDYEKRRRKFFEDSHAQPGEVNVSLFVWPDLLSLYFN